MISLAHLYRKIQKRIKEIEEQGITLLPLNENDLAGLMSSLVEMASRNGIQIRTCADELNLQQYGILPGKCVDDELITKVFGVESGDEERQLPAKAVWLCPEQRHRDVRIVPFRVHLLLRHNQL
jgi:hypothetical protein